VWVKSAFPDDDYLEPPEPARLYSGPPVPSSPAEAAWLRSISADEGLTVADSARPLGELVIPKPPAPDGRISTVLGRLTPEEYRQARKARAIDPHGNHFVSVRTERELAVRNRSGRLARVTVPVTLEEHLASENARREAEEHARRERLERAAVRSGTEKSPVASTARRFTRRSNWCWDSDATRGDDYYGDEDDPGYDDGSLDDEDQPELWFDDEWASDEYDHLARRAEPTDEEEDRAWEARYGAPRGALARDRRAVRAALHAESERIWSQRFTWPGLAGPAEEHRSHDEYELPDNAQQCLNPNDCDQPAKARGNRCSACYEYRRCHGGDERPTRLLNRQRRRQAS
jgi:hypothetical protein